MGARVAVSRATAGTLACLWSCSGWVGEPGLQAKLVTATWDMLFCCIVELSEAGPRVAGGRGQHTGVCQVPTCCLPAGLFEAGNVQQEARWAVQVYRGVLHALPASVRIWFGDVRDKAMASAFEVSCSFLGAVLVPFQHVSVLLDPSRCTFSGMQATRQWSLPPR